MADGQMLNLAGNLPPEILQQQQALNRQQQMAQLLLQQGMQQPQGQMVSGRYVAPSFFQYAAPLAQTYAATSLQKEGDKAALDLAEALRKRQTQEIEQFGELMKTDPSAAYRLAAQSYVPELRATGVKKMMPEDITLGEGQKRFTVMPDGSTRLVAQGEEKYRAPIQIDTGSRYELRDPRDPTKILQVIPKSLSPAESINMTYEGKIAGGMPSFGAPNVSAVSTGGTMPVSNAPTQTETITQTAKNQFLPANLPTYQYNPILSPKQNQEAAAEFSKKLQTNVDNAKDTFGLLKSAANVLGSNAPSSGRLQNIITGTGEIVGYSGKASKADADLKLIGDTLASKQPRFEGPQSNIDVQFYQKMAGDLGNPNLPIETRLNTINRMIELNKKYYPNGDWESIDTGGAVIKKNVLGGTRGLGAQTLSPTEYRKTLSPIDQEAFDFVRKNPNDKRTPAIKKRLGIE